ncbi:4-alpha-glucanotransferase, partial [Ruminococcus callidus]
DIPIYVAYDSVDVWVNPELFLLDKTRTPIDVAGCPPDVFSPTGQLWGNPLYDWKYHQKTGFAWWIQRLKSASTLYDTVRIDHFRGFESFYAIPYGKKTAEVGEWRKGPGMALFQAVKEALGDLSIIAEDLGFVTPEVRKLLKDSGYPGMKVLQFAFDDDPKSTYLPQNYTTTNCVAYTGTHDNMTLRGWIHGSPAKTIAFAKRYLHCRSSNDLPAAILRLTWSSTANLAVAQMQDFLDAGPEGRMNTPSTTGGNWQYRTLTSDFNPRLAKRIYQLNELFNRLPEESLQKPVSKKRQKAAAKAAAGTKPMEKKEKKS